MATVAFQSEADRILTDAIRGSDDIQEIWLTDVSGKVIAATNSEHIGEVVSDERILKAIRSGPFLSEYRRGNGPLETLLSAPLTNSQGQLLGIVQVVNIAKRLTDIVSNPVGLGRTGEALMGRLEGTDRIRYILPSRLTNAESISIAEAPSMLKAIAGQQDFELAQYGEQDVLIAYEPVPFQQGIVSWGLVVKITTAEAYLPLQSLRRILLPLGLLLLIPAIISAYWLASRYARPIMNLARSADIFASGNLKHRVPVEEDDEIGVLSRAFNDMASQLEASYDVLERRVAERTAELSQANRALERSNRDLEQFAYVASHDLQEPLRAISGFAT